MATTKLQMAQNNVGSLVVLKPGEQQNIAGIITERGNFLPRWGEHTYTKSKIPVSFCLNPFQVLIIMIEANVIIADEMNEKADYLRKVIAQDRPSKYTRVAEIMTDQVISATLRHLFC